ncbi:NLI interacting factor-like phosphatase [Carpediemonas membranifera]|uniref:NLI interacting factor-like phosphatase n=1 Tax=Carpediemonas membranifera TaxID=201153 RepID=A0A8J6AWH0_9EUKA|nr:NLI interacting factor-like phosphatase [Carpediemonas membranifera]|eukprot:KAG9396586.1 NLI interacting factor-like phosphatase [Carpediemonas membranifera]
MGKEMNSILKAPSNSEPRKSAEKQSKCELRRTRSVTFNDEPDIHFVERLEHCFPAPRPTNDSGFGPRSKQFRVMIEQQSILQKKASTKLAVLEVRHVLLDPTQQPPALRPGVDQLLTALGELGFDIAVWSTLNADALATAVRCVFGDSGNNVIATLDRTFAIRHRRLTKAGLRSHFIKPTSMFNPLGYDRVISIDERAYAFLWNPIGSIIVSPWFAEASGGSAGRSRASVGLGDAELARVEQLLRDNV